MTIRERFEKLQRYGHLDDADTGESWLTVGNEGSWLKRADVLAIADELDAERAKGGGIAGMIAETTTAATAERISGLEMMAKMFIAETGASITDCVLVEQMDGSAITWRIEKRSPKRPCGCPVDELDAELAPASESTQRKVAAEIAAVTEEQATAFAVSCLDPESRLAILRQWCGGCGGAMPCNCERNE